MLSAPPLPPLSPTHPAYPRPAHQTPATAPPLRFRSSSPDKCFSSESFNLPYDLRRLFGLERIYVNPRVITAYKWRFYLWFKYAMRHWVVKWFMETADKSREDLPQFVYYWVGETSRLFGTVGNALREERSIFTENQFETSY
ncbi:hypothetical protein DFH08DRAFT_975771 [Mycena albidolilacea]|uniref:Uncharacterized protein n=1 Tax=Mycena albidolilacea TaxID=1033008 RepID=A0AAD6Z4L6_9AGAR|nr:hypothetical protein DFH08DRAFT_975771 [Mycena albidolilacea]